MWFEIPAQRRRVFQDIDRFFVRGHENTFFLALEPLDEELQGKRRLTGAGLSGNQNRPPLGKSTLNERVESDNSRRYAFRL